jgi:hypothetical protein
MEHQKWAHFGKIWLRQRLAELCKLSSAARSGRARVAASLLGCGYASLNGHRLGNSVLGSVSQFDKTIRYELFDVLPLVKFGDWNVVRNRGCHHSTK